MKLTKREKYFLQDILNKRIVSEEESIKRFQNSSIMLVFRNQFILSCNNSIDICKKILNKIER